MHNLLYSQPSENQHFYDSIYDILCDINFINRKRKKENIANVVSTFDIEATSFYNGSEKLAVMYAWVFGINGRCIRGRTWEEFLKVLEIVQEHYSLGGGKRLIIFVHNLSYEFQWFQRYFEWEKVFALDSRKPVQAITKNGFEFRCSYILTGLSLASVGESLIRYKAQKMVGDLDYNLIRHSGTELTEKEWGYILNDGLVVMAKIQEEIERVGDITKLPLTKTGYVRQLCREKLLKGDDRFNYVSLMRHLTMTPEQYHQLKRAYTGGFTHANLNYVGEVLDEVDSYDETSAYPAAMVSEKYPMSIPHRYKPVDDEDFLLMLKTFCCMFDIKFHNIRSTCSFENYISESRCYVLEHPVVNNGRVVEADVLQTTLTEQDFFIIAEMYEWDYFEISNFNYFYKAYLPKDLIMCILELYKTKTELKDVEEKLEEYMVSKGMVNSLYGMCVTDPCRDDIVYKNEWIETKANIEEQIEKYNKDRQRILSYAWGVWVTAYARRNLFKAILEFEDDYAYSDTDSVKGKNGKNHKEFFEDYNAEIQDKIMKCLEYHKIPAEMANPKTIKGVEKPLGVWEYEKTYKHFKTLGAKRYMYEVNDEVHITIAGVNKKAGAKYLKDTYKTPEEIFKNFEEHLTFPSSYFSGGLDICGSGKLCHTYIDYPFEIEVTDYLGNSRMCKELSCVHMEPTEYTLSLAAEFRNLILGIKESHIL